MVNAQRPDQCLSWWMLSIIPQLRLFSSGVRRGFAIGMGQKLAQAVFYLAIGLEALIFGQMAGYPYWPQQLVLPRDAEVALFMILNPLSPLLLVLLFYGRPLELLAIRAASRSQGLRVGFFYLTRPLSSIFARLRSFDFAECARSIRLLSHPRPLFGNRNHRLWFRGLSRLPASMESFRQPARRGLPPLSTMAQRHTE